MILIEKGKLMGEGISVQRGVEGRDFRQYRIIPDGELCGAA